MISLYNFIKIYKGAKMFSKEFLGALKSASAFSDKAVLKYPITTINSDANDVVINIDASNLGCSEFDDTGVYELTKFLNMFSIFGEAEVKREDNLLKIQSTTENATFTLCDLNLLEAHNLDAKIIGSLTAFPSISEFNMNSIDLQTIKKASSILNELNAFKIEGIGNNTTISLDFHNRFNSSQNSYKKDYLGTSTQDFTLMLGIDNIQKLPNADYKVSVKYNSDKSAYRVLFEAENYTVLISKLAD